MAYVETKSCYWSFTTSQEDGLDYEIILGWNVTRQSFYFEVMLDDQIMTQAKLDTHPIKNIQDLEETIYVVIPPEIKAKLFVDSKMINFCATLNNPETLNCIKDYIETKHPDKKDDFTKLTESLSDGSGPQYNLALIPKSTSTALVVVNNTGSYPSSTTYASKTFQDKILELFD